MSPRMPDAMRPVRFIIVVLVGLTAASFSVGWRTIDAQQPARDDDPQEIILTIEANQESEEPAVWQYGFAPNSIAELHVTLDGAEVWTRPYINFTAAYADGPYSIAVTPMDEHELREIERGDAK